MAGTSNPLYPTLGECIAANRRLAGLSQRQLAAQAGLHYSVLSRVERGEYMQLTPDILQRIADVLEIDSAELLRYVGVEPSLPEPRVYFRRKLGVNAATADVLARLVEDYQAKE
jgi:transcriptional regulator with XRE-family HTH domain